MFLRNILNCGLFLLLTQKSKGLPTSKRKISGLLPIQLSSQLIPCLPQDSIVFSGICVQCLSPERYQRISRNGNCSSFKQSSSSKFSEKHNVSFPHFSGPHLVVQGNEVVRGRKKCPIGFGCLRNVNGSFEHLESWRLAEGSEYLSKRKLRVVTIDRHPFSKHTNEGKFTGVCFEFMDAIREKYNFSMYTFLPYDGNWGAEMANGSWNGMVGQVQRHEADIGVAGFSVTLQRSQVISFSNSYHQEETAILIPPPKVSGAKLTILIRPLSSLVWGSLLLTVLVLAPTLYTLHIWTLRLSGEKERKSFLALLGELLHFMIGSLVQESVISPVNKTTRFLIILWWFLTLVMANIYVAYLVSYLSAPKYTNIVEGLEDLVGQSKISWTFRKNTAHESLFRSSTSSGIYKQVGDGVKVDELVASDYAGVDKVLTGDYAFIKEKSFLDVALGQDFIQSGGQCRLTVAKEKFFKVETALILPKDSKFLTLVDIEITRSVSSGLMEKWKAIHWQKNLWCEDAINFIPTTLPKTRKLEIEDLQGAWFLLGSGALLALVSFLWEVLSNWRKHLFPNIY